MKLGKLTQSYELRGVRLVMVIGGVVSWWLQAEERICHEQFRIAQ